MTEENLKLEKEELGEIVIAPVVLEVIIGVQTSKIEGVYGMRGSITSNIAEKLGRTNHGKGINISENEEGGLVVDIYTYLEYGVNVPRVALEIQKKVKEQVLYMTGIDLAEVNVHIVAIIPEKIEQLDADAFFEEEEVENA
ncbi:MAG: Asp23/Gls24 family envelope stress response protein [Streptococcaceae bacterium]|nr:Asp23/Gls24 family envelope stress response protein [Streptococcaceae bacterium]